ncbi:CopG family transcriptional regulator [Candidatus Aerophobetes bacterium]|uniref:CopG family transcriptional regulator n=1 Tax=Aerophobetes bacterium TaxID=2030807 RepID=A0A523S2I1_UNCAE|nr:MAG: CopG family transcriptional regulator [Candidatus Aerophobetes bacterium]
MKRMQIYLSTYQWRNLSLLSNRRHTSITELIRQAIDQTYLSKNQDHFSEALDSVTGMWADRTDIGLTQDYLRSLREDKRIERLGL